MQSGKKLVQCTSGRKWLISGQAHSPVQVLEIQPIVHEIDTAPHGAGGLPGMCRSNTTRPGACYEPGWLFLTAALQDSTLAPCTS